MYRDSNFKSLLLCCSFFAIQVGCTSLPPGYAVSSLNGTAYCAHAWGGAAFKTKNECLASIAMKDGQPVMLSPGGTKEELAPTPMVPPDQEAEAMRLTQIKEYVQANPGESAFEGVAIKRKVTLNMPKELLILAWGKPDRINSSSGDFGNHEQLIYADSFVFINNGRVSSWRTSL